MTKFTTISLTAIAVATLVASGAASAQTAGIATASPDASILSAKAFAAANTQISTTYKTQLDQAAAQDTALNTQIRTLIDTNKDGQISQAELATGQNAQSAIGAQVKAAQSKASPAIDQLRQPAIKAQAYALEMLSQKYEPALQAVAKAKGINIVLAPNAVQYAPPATDITEAVIAEIDRTTPSISIAAPANFQPSQDTVQLLNQYRQAVYINELRRQQAAQGTAAPTPSATGGAAAPAPSPAKGKKNEGR
ncbi:OmpH family outer membrane protein [Sphingomonas oligophenolica]|uniref:OmpH family outer membrane protein n=1 Tax=Sphingomonas oligophenolica TaxID=301154 RepID=A0A502CNP2_9SPHN|nr:OmpH family outer membrane protein [Sphingomonas oligophenolica]TPG14264.1 OmpH family outer membrane protein [Sphingomonas oligophenolica]